MYFLGQFALKAGRVRRPFVHRKVLVPSVSTRSFQMHDLGLVEKIEIEMFMLASYATKKALDNTQTVSPLRTSWKRACPRRLAPPKRRTGWRARTASRPRSRCFGGTRRADFPTPSPGTLSVGNSGRESGTPGTPCGSTRKRKSKFNFGYDATNGTLTPAASTRRPLSPSTRRCRAHGAASGR